MTTTDNSPDVASGQNTGNSAGPILEAFDAIAAKGGDPKDIAGGQFQLPFYFAFGLLHSAGQIAILHAELDSDEARVGLAIDEGSALPRI